MLIRYTLLSKKFKFYLKLFYKISNILYIKIRIVQNNIFIVYIIKQNNVFIHEIYTLNKIKLFKNKALLYTFLLKEFVKESYEQFYIKYKNILIQMDLKINLQIYFIKLNLFYINTVIKFFNSYNILLIEFYNISSHNGCRLKKPRRKKTMNLIL